MVHFLHILLVLVPCCRITNQHAPGTLPLPRVMMSEVPGASGLPSTGTHRQESRYWTVHPTWGSGCSSEAIWGVSTRQFLGVAGWRSLCAQQLPVRGQFLLLEVTHSCSVLRPRGHPHQHVLYPRWVRAHRGDRHCIRPVVCITSLPHGVAVRHHLLYKVTESRELASKELDSEDVPAWQEMDLQGSLPQVRTPGGRPRSPFPRLPTALCSSRSSHSSFRS